MLMRIKDIVNYNPRNGNFKRAVMIMIILFKCEEENLMASLETGIKPIIWIQLLLKTAIIR